jgi:hypothetical protein
VDRHCSGAVRQFFNQQKGRAPLEALPCTAISADFIFYACIIEALPLIMPLNPASGCRCPASDASIDEVTQRNQRYRCSNHRAPAFQLSCHIDPRVASQVRVLVFTLEVSLASIHVSFISVVGIILSSIFCHDVTSCILWFSVVSVLSCLTKRYGIRKIRQWEPVGWVMAGKNYPYVEIDLNLEASK